MGFFLLAKVRPVPVKEPAAEVADVYVIRTPQTAEEIAPVRAAVGTWDAVGTYVCLQMCSVA